MKVEKVTRPPLVPASPQIAVGRLLSVLDVCGVLGIKPPKLRAMAARGTISYYRIGRSIRFSQGDVAAFLTRARRAARAERGL